jgi:hypothetical protein
MTDERKSNPHGKTRRAEITDAVTLLHQYWLSQPSLRLGQLLMNIEAFPHIGDVGQNDMSTDCYYVDDQCVIDALKKVTE